MAITITATAGSATANSYASEAEFIAYAATRPNVLSGTTASGSTITDAEKRALIQAQRELTVLSWLGSRTDSTQALSWPREFVVDPDAPAITGLTDIAELYFDDDEIPTRIVNANIELALAFLKAGTTDLSAQDSTTGIKQKAVDVLSTTYAEPYQRPTGLARFPLVVSYIAPMLEGSAGGIEVSRV